MPDCILAAYVGTRKLQIGRRLPSIEVAPNTRPRPACAFDPPPPRREGRFPPALPKIARAHRKSAGERTARLSPRFVRVAERRSDGLAANGGSASSVFAVPAAGPSILSWRCARHRNSPSPVLPQHVPDVQDRVLADMARDAREFRNAADAMEAIPIVSSHEDPKQTQP
jgi:hypothetical protein